MRQIIKKIIQIGSLVWVGYIPAQLIVLQQALDAPRFVADEDCIKATNNIIYADNSKRNNDYRRIILYVPSTPTSTEMSNQFNIKTSYSTTYITKKLSEIDFQTEIQNLMLRFYRSYGGTRSINLPTQMDIGLEYQSGWKETGYWAYALIKYVTYRRSDGTTYEVHAIAKTETRQFDGTYLYRDLDTQTCSKYYKTTSYYDPSTLKCRNALLPEYQNEYYSRYSSRVNAEAYETREESKKSNFVSIRFTVEPVNLVEAVYSIDKKKCTINMD